ncbi:MAG: hypothetical protein ACI81W_002426 [Saprospiraceae bacterium]|jgi:hypothetical protein
MTKNCLPLIIVFSFLLNNASAQSCLPDGIKFSTQAQIDSFPINYPECTQILKDVRIKENVAGTITNLDSLYQIINIGGDLRVTNNAALISLKGLNNLISIGGYLKVWKNASLTNLSGLDNLTSIHTHLAVNFNDALISLSGLGNLDSVKGDFTVISNELLKNLNGLENLTTISGNFIVSTNTSLISLKGIENLSSIGGDLKVEKNASLTNLTGLDKLTSIGGYLEVYNNGSLTNLNGLNNLASVGGYLKVKQNASLTSLSGLDNIISVGESIDVYDNASLEDLSGLENITSTDEKTKKKKKAPHKTWVTSIDKSFYLNGYLREVGDSVIVISNLLSTMEPNYTTQNINIGNVKTIIFRKKDKIGKSIFYGALIGFGIGAFSAVLDGDDVPGKDCYDPSTNPGGLGGIFTGVIGALDPCRTVGDKVLLRGLPLGLTGALLGGIAGLAKIKIPINGNHRTMKIRKGELLEFRILD